MILKKLIVYCQTLIEVESRNGHIRNFVQIRNSLISKTFYNIYFLSSP